MWLAHTGFGLALAVYLLYNYISALPRDILESAFMDGASHFTVFTRLILPLSVPALASFAIFQFLWVWNDLLVAMVFLGTPHHGAPLERGGNGLEFLLGVSSYSAPLARLARLRSAGVTDLLTDEQGQVSGVTVHDRLGDDDLDVRARRVIDATGVWLGHPEARIADAHAKGACLASMRPDRA